MDDGILHYYLSGRPVHYHDQIELGLPHDRWLPVHFEWSGIGMDIPVLVVKLADSDINGWLKVPENALFRWPAGTESAEADQNSHCTHPLRGVQEPVLPAGFTQSGKRRGFDPRPPGPL